MDWQHYGDNPKLRIFRKIKRTGGKTKRLPMLFHVIYICVCIKNTFHDYERIVSNKEVPRVPLRVGLNDTYYLILPVHFTLTSRDWNILTTVTHLLHEIQFHNKSSANESQNFTEGKKSAACPQSRFVYNSINCVLNIRSWQIHLIVIPKITIYS